MVYSKENNYSKDSLEMFMREIRQYDLLSEEEEQTLARKYREGDEAAREKMMQCNLRLVVSIARKYNTVETIDLMDLIQEGCLGLSIAIDRFDPDLGFKFSTYASWWIMQQITRYIANNQRLIRVPVHLHEEARKVRKVKDALTSKLGHEPTDKELAKELGVSLERLRYILMAFDRIISINLCVNKEDMTDECTIEDFLKSEDKSPEEIVFENETCRVLKECMSELPEREQKILIYRFGLDGQPVRTLEQIGKMMNVTRERVRQLEMNSLRKLRAPHNYRKLKGLL